MKAKTYTDERPCPLQPVRPARADPLPPRTRALLVIDHGLWTEIDPATGRVLSKGEAECANA